MPMKLFLRKLPGGTLVPDSDEAAEYLQGVKNGDVLAAEVTKPRNYGYHKKYFSLLNLAFDAWEPEAREHRGMPVQKSFERFRKDVAIACGFYELTVNIKGETRAEAKSISFANMSADEFDRLYTSTITLFIEKYQILRGYRSAEEVDAVIEAMLSYA